MGEQDNPVIIPNGRSQTGWRLGLAVLLCLPTCAWIIPLLKGEIPFFMDTALYFFPLRWYAAHLLREGQMPWWNRAILTGMPLFSNPQAALAYPGNWPMLAWPGAAAFSLPMTLQLGLWSALTAAALRRIGVGRGASLIAGCFCLAGSYGWTRFQFGNYLNVLPWWPLWLISGWQFARTGRRRHLAFGAGAVAMMLLGGAHQLAAYAAYGFSIFALWMVLSDRGCRVYWIVFAFFSASVGLLLGAAGWMPQWAFLTETARAESLDPNLVLAGTFGSIREVAWALIGHSRGGFSDAEGIASIGLFGIVAAGIIPRDSAARRIWIGAWLMALACIIPVLRPVWKILLDLVPAIGVFHDPRRMLGFAQWALILAAGCGLGSRVTSEDERKWRIFLFSLPAVGLWLGLFALICIHDGVTMPNEFRIELAAGWVAGIIALGPWGSHGPARGRVMVHLAAILGVIALGSNTWRTTDLTRIEVERLLGAGPSPVKSALEKISPGRFFSLDWKRDSSYDFRRPDLNDWMLPNLAMLHPGLEDVGGYEPARSPRYDRWLASACDWPGGRQPWASHFGLVSPPHPALDPIRPGLAEAGIKSAILPVWGIPVYLREAGGGRWVGQTMNWPENFDVRVVYVPAENSTPKRELTFRCLEHPIQSFALNHDTRTTESARILPGTSNLTRVVVDLVKAPAAGWNCGGEMVYQIDLRMAPEDIFAGIYLWSPAMAGRFAPEAAGEIAMAAKYAGPSRLSIIPLAEEDRGAAREIRDEETTANRLKFNVRWEGINPATLEIHDAYWKGWRAKIDGAEVQVRPSGQDGTGLWRWIEIPEARPNGSKEHEVTLEFFPPRLIPAICLTGLGGVILAMALMLRWSRGGAKGLERDSLMST